MAKPFVTAANKLASVTRPQPSATVIVKKILLTHGPQTTRSLHAILHSSQAPFLPSRPPPSNFLQGVGRLSNPNKYRTSPNETSPGFEKSSEGVWSISYLKKNVLKQMESSEQVYKITRGKFDTVTKRAIAAAAIDDATVSSTEEGTDSSVTGEEITTIKKDSIVVASSKTKKGAAKKEEDEHVWIEGDKWRSLLPSVGVNHPNQRKDTFLEIKARQKMEKIENMEDRERIGLRVVR